MKFLSSKFIIIGLTALIGSASAPISFAQDAEPENEATIDTQMAVAQAEDPYESYEQIKALGVVDPAVIPDPVEPIPEADTIPSDAVSAIDAKPYSDGEAIADIEADIIETAQNEPDDQSAGEADGLDLRIVTLDDGDVEKLELETEAEVDLDTQPVADAQSAKSMAALPSLDDGDNVIDAPRLARADILPFFLSAQEYLAARGGGEAAQTSLLYKVTTEPLSAEPQEASNQDVSDLAKSEIVQLLIGPDYVAQQSDQPGSEFRIYDFKYNRFLRILPPAEEGTSANLINVSLYALAHRNTRTVASMTDQGKRDVVDLGPIKLDAFWMESAMSWAMTDRLMDLQTERADEAVEITYKDEPAFAMTLDELAYTSPAQSDALLVFAHHSWPVHPSALREFFAAPAPVKSMTIISKTPSAPLGAKQVWTLMERKDGMGTFPLPGDVVSQAIHAGADDPIAFVINAAARGTALEGRPSKDGVAAEFREALEAGDLQKAWLSGQRYMTLFGSCEAHKADSVCEGLTAIEANEEQPASLKVLMGAFEDAKTSSTRARALKALKPYLNDPQAPPIILRMIGITRAKLGTATARAAGLETLDAQTLMKASLARDPYDPQTYLGLAQYKASRGEFEAAWDIYDVLRSSINNETSKRFGVDKVEAALLERAPGYFEIPVMVEVDDQ